MASSETSIQQLAEAARSMQEKASAVEMLEEAVVAATEIIEGCDLAGMSIVNYEQVLRVCPTASPCAS